MQGSLHRVSRVVKIFFFYVLGTNVLGTGAGIQYYTPQTIMTPQKGLYKNLWCLAKATDTSLNLAPIGDDDRANPQMGGVWG